MTQKLTAWRLLAFGALALLGTGFMSSSASAQSANTSFQVTANIPDLCLISTSGPMAFGAYDATLGTDLDTTMTVDINCTPGTIYTVGLDDGANFSGTRRMANGGNFLNYEIFIEGTHTTRWDNIAPNVNSGTFVAGPPVSYTAYGRIPGSQNTVPSSATNYTDSIMATVTY